MEIVCKKTTELSEKELGQISLLFNEVFGRSSNPDNIRKNYIGNPYGTSYHTLLYENGRLIGHNAGMPGEYNIEGKTFKVLNNVGLMISPESRGLSGFMALLKASYKHYQEENVAFLYSLPNTNSYPLLTKLKYMQDIGHVSTFCLPYNIGGIKKSLNALNILSRICCELYLNISLLFASKQVWLPKIHKTIKSFTESRYKRVRSQYKRCEIEDNRFVYTLEEFQGVKAAFLLDVERKNSANFCKACKYIIKQEKGNFDVIIYVGHLPFSNIGLIKVPKKYEPKPFRLVGHTFDKEIITPDMEKLIYNISNWDINLSDDDVL